MIQDYVVNNIYEILSAKGTVYIQSDVKEVFDTFKKRLENKFKAKNIQKTDLKVIGEHILKKKAKSSLDAHL